MERITLHETINVGDAGTPVDTDIYIEFYENESGITVTHNEDNASFDNPPSYWADTIKERIEDHFHPKTVNFN